MVVGALFLMSFGPSARSIESWCVVMDQYLLFRDISRHLHWCLRLSWYVFKSSAPKRNLENVIWHFKKGQHASSKEWHLLWQHITIVIQILHNMCLSRTLFHCGIHVNLIHAIFNFSQMFTFVTRTHFFLPCFKWILSDIYVLDISFCTKHHVDKKCRCHCKWITVYSLVIFINQNVIKPKYHYLYV